MTILLYKCYLIVIGLVVGTSRVEAFSSVFLTRRTNSISYSNFFTSNTRLRAENQELTPIEDPAITANDTDDDDDDEVDELVDSITEKLGEMEGLWYSDDFYGSHGREWIKVSTTLMGESATSALVAVKVTGDPNVPAGCVTFQTKSWPTLGETVQAQIQVRANPKDPDGFSWLPAELSLIAKDQIRLMCQYNRFMKSDGLFYKINVNQGKDSDDESA